MEERAKLKYIVQRRHNREQLAKELKDAVNFESEQRREISSLRRSDHTENFKRKSEFEKLLKQKLISDIEDKRDRGQLIQYEQ